MRLFDETPQKKLTHYYGPLLRDLSDFVTVAQASESSKRFRSLDGKRSLDRSEWANQALNIIHFINSAIQEPNITNPQKIIAYLDAELKRSIKRYVRIDLFSLPGIIKKHLPLDDQHATVFWEPHFPRSTHYIRLILNQLPSLACKSEFCYFLYQESQRISIDLEQELHLLLKIPYQDYVDSAGKSKLKPETLEGYQEKYYPKFEEGIRDSLKKLIHLIDKFEKSQTKNAYQINKAWCFIAAAFCEWNHPEKDASEKSESLQKIHHQIEKEFFTGEKLEEGWYLLDENDEAGVEDTDEIPLSALKK